MQAQYSNQLVTSFTLWLDYVLCNKGQGYSNITGQLLYPQIDSGIPYTSYASPYKQWVYDSSVSGAIVPSGIYNSAGQFLTRQSGVIIDFINGRILSITGNLGNALSGTFSRKEYNVYFSTATQVDLYLESITNENRNLAYTPTGVQPYGFEAPCVIVTESAVNNTPFALGGQETTNNTFRLFIVSNNNWSQTAINSLLADAAHHYLPLVDYTFPPIALYGDIKSGWQGYNGYYYNYKQTVPNPSIYINNVYALKLTNQTNQNKTFSLSSVEFDVSNIRAPVNFC